MACGGGELGGRACAGEVGSSQVEHEAAEGDDGDALVPVGPDLEEDEVLMWGFESRGKCTACCVVLTEPIYDAGEIRLGYQSYERTGVSRTCCETIANI